VVKLLALCSRGLGFKSKLRLLVHKCIFGDPQGSLLELQSYMPGVMLSAGGLPLC